MKTGGWNSKEKVTVDEPMKLTRMTEWTTANRNQNHHQYQYHHHHHRRHHHHFNSEWIISHLILQLERFWKNALASLFPALFVIFMSFTLWLTWRNLSIRWGDVWQDVRKGTGEWGGGEQCGQNMWHLLYSITFGDIFLFCFRAWWV